MKLRILLGALVVIFGLGAGLEAGDIYQWVDKDGVQHFTDGPPPPGAERVEGLSDTKPDEPGAKAGPARQEKPGPVEKNENPSPEPDDAGPVERDENRTTTREDYWRRMGWGNDASEAEGQAPGKAGENRPPEQEEAGRIEGGENAFPEGNVE